MQGFQRFVGRKTTYRLNSTPSSLSFPQRQSLSIINQDETVLQHMTNAPGISNVTN